jgi:hypothetical protein
MRALSAILPTPDETWLLRACLYSGESARHAWTVCSRRARDPASAFREDGRGLKRLAPLLHDALGRSDLAAPPGFVTVLRTARVREELRSRQYRRIRGEVLSALAGAAVPVIVLKGAALGELVYDDAALRHSHAIDLLVGEGDLGRAAGALRSSGFRPSGTGPSPPGLPVVVEHHSGLPIWLHARLFRGGYYRSRSDEVWARSETRAIGGLPARVLSPVDNLLHVCGDAAGSRSPDSLLWVCDAWSLLQRTRDLDWGLLLEIAADSRIVLPLTVVLGYLATELEGPVPGSVLARLRATAETVDDVGRDVALFGARSIGGGPVLLRSALDWHERVLLLKWMLLPSAGYLCQAYGIRRRSLLPVYYAYRVLGHARSGVRIAVPGLARRATALTGGPPRA